MYRDNYDVKQVNGSQAIIIIVLHWSGGIWGPVGDGFQSRVWKIITCCHSIVAWTAERATSFLFLEIFKLRKDILPLGM